MCMFCAAIPAAGAVGAKLNADQKRKETAEDRKGDKRIATVTLGAMLLLAIGSVVYHTTMFERGA